MEDTSRRALCIWHDLPAFMVRVQDSSLPQAVSSSKAWAGPGACLGLSKYCRINNKERKEGFRGFVTEDRLKLQGCVGASETQMNTTGRHRLFLGWVLSQLGTVTRPTLQLKREMLRELLSASKGHRASKRGNPALN